jgi:NADH-ubiquinone oxidoreductase chain 2
MAYTFRSLNINLKDSKYSPIQLISQLKEYYNINYILSISLSITLFSFAGIPPLVGFFAKQMILTAAINKGFILVTLIAIITSVISAVYYLFIIKTIFFEKSNNIINEVIIKYKNNILYNYTNKGNKLILSSSYSLIISIITLLITLFMFFDQEIIRLIYIL